MHLLIDGDIICYRAAAAAEHMWWYVHHEDAELEQGIKFRYRKEAVEYLDGFKEVGIDPGMYFITSERDIEPAEHAIWNARSILDTILAVPHTGYTMFLQGEGNYRKEIDPEYKAGRAEKPTHYTAVREYLIKNGAVLAHGCEADDLISMEQYKNFFDGTDTPEGDNCSSCIVSIDKDLNIVPGWHYNFVTGEKYWISVDAGLRNFYTQVLTGDPVDNIRGLAGVGPVGAAKILKDAVTEQEMYLACRFRYEHHSKLQDLDQTCRLLWMSKQELDDYIPPIELTQKEQE